MSGDYWSRLAIVVGLALTAGGGFASQVRAHGPAADRPQATGFAGLFPRNESYDFPVPQPGTYALPPIRVVPDGAVLDQEGERHRLAPLLAGRISIVSFVYLNCADACPLATGLLFDIFHASGGAPDLRERVQLVTISFDPLRDTPAAMVAAAAPVLGDPRRERKLRWHFLTTSSSAELAPLLSGFGQAVDGSGGAETLNHLLRLYLVDSRGRIRNIYGLGMIDPRLVMADVETLLIEARAD